MVLYFSGDKGERGDAGQRGGEGIQGPKGKRATCYYYSTMFSENNGGICTCSHRFPIGKSAALLFSYIYIYRKY